MKYARFWIPLLAGFAFGGGLAWWFGRGSMRELLEAAKSARTAYADQPGNLEKKVSEPSTSALAMTDEARFGRLFGALQESRALKRRSEIHAALGDLAAQDMEALLERVEKKRIAVNSPDLANAILERWFELDPKAAKEWVRKRPDMKGYWLVWAKTDPESAFQEALANPKERWALEMMKLAAAGLAAGNDAEQGRILLTLPQGELRDYSLAALFHTWGRTDPTGALEFLKSMPAETPRSWLADAILMEMRNRDLESAKSALVGVLPILLPEQATSQIASIAEKLAGKDPKVALDWVNSLPEANRPQAAFGAVARQWAKADPGNALAWCVANGIDVVEFDPRRGGSSSGQSVVSTAMQANAEQTLRWIRSQPAGAARDTMLELALMPTRSSFREPAPIAQNTALLLDALNTLPSETQSRVAKKVGGNLASLGPAKMAKMPELQSWINQMPDPGLRDAAIVGAGRQFSGYGAAETFLSQFGEGEERDAAVEGFATTHANNHPERAADLAVAISDIDRRWRVLDGFVVDWLREDPKAAGQWLDSANSILPEWTAAWRKEATFR